MALSDGGANISDLGKKTTIFTGFPPKSNKRLARAIRQILNQGYMAAGEFTTKVGRWP